MRHAKLFSILVFLFLGLYGAVGFYFLPLAGYQGGLTRMAMLPESLFGWTRPQPAIDPALMKQSSWQDADVLVVGDSFSEPRIWQTILTAHGLRVRTEHWTMVRGLCEDFSPWLRAQGFKGQYVVFEAVERNVRDGFEQSVHCRKMAPHYSADADTPREPPPAVFDPNKKNWSGRLSVGIQTRRNQSEYEKLSAQSDFKSWISGAIRVARVAGGCELFSHASCRDALFLAMDGEPDLGEDVLGNMDILNGRMDGFTPIWVIVPNKSTAYLYPEKHFWDKLEAQLRSVNVLKLVRQAIQDKTIDLYPANDSHLSTAGYLLMGEAIYRNLERDRHATLGHLLK